MAELYLYPLDKVLIQADPLKLRLVLIFFIPYFFGAVSSHELEIDLIASRCVLNTGEIIKGYYSFRVGVNIRG
jgi:hypothetical protein